MKFITTKIVFTSIVVLSLMLVAQSCTDSKGEGNKIPKQSEPVPVTILPLEKSTTTSSIKASGQLTTDDETTLGFKTGGIVRAVLVKEGDKVKKGQLLATLDLTEIEALVAQARHGFEKASRDLARVTNLYKDSVATLEQLQNAQTGFEIAKEQLTAAGFNREHSAIHAPADGYVLRKFVKAGQVVSTGDAVLMTNGALQGNWILKAGVSDRQWAAVNISDKAIIHVDAVPGQPFTATVIRKSETSDPATGTFTLELQLKSNDKRLASGMFGSAEITLGESHATWSVPYEAVLDANGNEGFVFITNDEKTAIKQPVTVESFNGNSILISKGLENAKALIVSGSAYLSDQSPIIPVK